MSAPQRRLVPISEACGELGSVSRSMLYELVNRGDLIRVNIGRRSFITADSLAAFIDSLETAAAVVQRD
jgi:hypothetical protein